MDRVVHLGFSAVPGFVIEVTSTEDLKQDDAIAGIVPRLASMLGLRGDGHALGCYPRAVAEWRSSEFLSGVPDRFEIWQIRREHPCTANCCCSLPGLLAKEFVEFFLRDVAGVDISDWAEIDRQHLAFAGAKRDYQLTESELQGIVDEYCNTFSNRIGSAFPISLEEQLRYSLTLITRRWQSELARKCKRESSWLSIAVRRLFWSKIEGLAASGIATFDIASDSIHLEACAKERGLEDLLAGTGTVSQLDQFDHVERSLSKEIRRAAATLNSTGVEQCRLCFYAMESGILIDEIVNVPASPETLLRRIADRCGAGSKSWKRDLKGIQPADISMLLMPRLVSQSADLSFLASGLAGAGGCATGHLCFDSQQIRDNVNAGVPAIFAAVSPEPEDTAAALTAAGIVFETGGATSHIAVISRGAGKPCVLGVSDMQISPDHSWATFGSRRIDQGSWLTIDGTAGTIYAGRATLHHPDLASLPSLQTVLTECDRTASIRVFANADTAQEAATAFGYGAEGLGLCRLEHLLIRPEPLPVLQRVLASCWACSHIIEELAYLRTQVSEYPSSAGARAELARAEQLANANSIYAAYTRGIEQLRGHLVPELAAMFSVAGNRPVIIRLLDPPINEFLGETAPALFADLGLSAQEAAKLVAAVEEPNPMLGARGVRLCQIAPELTVFQIRSIFEAAMAAGGTIDHDVWIMAPFVIDAAELKGLRSVVETYLRQENLLQTRRYHLGAMIETPRAALMAGELAVVADFLSFGTNDLTQLTWACSRDSAETTFLRRGAYREFASPFVSFDEAGVGALVSLAVSRARRNSPSIQLGVCGEHGGEPQAIQFFASHGIDYVSCSAVRIPVAKFVAGQVGTQSGAADGMH